MTQTSPRSKSKKNGLGCEGDVAGWSPTKERIARTFDQNASGLESEISPAPRDQKHHLLSRSSRARLPKIAAE